MGRQIQIGDVFEIKTPRGLSYIQNIYSKDYGANLIRVLPGSYPSRPSDLRRLVDGEELYFTFYIPSKHDLVFVSNLPIPAKARRPILRHAMGWDPIGKTNRWIVLYADQPLTADFLSKATQHSLTPEISKLSMNTIWPHKVLVERLLAGWTPDRAIEFREREMAQYRTLREKFPRQDASEDKMKHFLYFKKRKNADDAAEFLQSRGFSAEVCKSADGKEWLTLAIGSRPDVDEIEVLRDALESVANKLDGEYDGWEMAMPTDKANEKVN